MASPVEEQDVVSVNRPTTENELCAPLNSVVAESDIDIEPLVKAMQDTLTFHTRNFFAKLNKPGVFFLDLKGDRHIMYETFIDSLPQESRKQFNCKLCKKFLRQWGVLCLIQDDGSLHPLFWPNPESVPPYFKNAVQNIHELFSNGTVSEEFKADFDDKCVLMGSLPTAGRFHFFLQAVDLRQGFRYKPGYEKPASVTYALLNKVRTENSVEVIDRTLSLFGTRNNSLLPFIRIPNAIHWLRHRISIIQSRNISDPNKLKNLITRMSRSSLPRKKKNTLTDLQEDDIPGCLLKWVREGKDFQVINILWREMVDDMGVNIPRGMYARNFQRLDEEARRRAREGKWPENFDAEGVSESVLRGYARDY